jgi:lysophospholipase L1-like esterase
MSTLDRRELLALASAAGAGIVGLGGAAEAAARVQFRDGDTIVFLGDSITQQRLYTTYIESYLLTRYPKRKLTFRNSGWGGDTIWLRQRTQGTDMSDAKLFAATGDERDRMVVRMVRHGLERDVLPLKPSVVLINFGMNDSRKLDAGLPVFARAFAEVLLQLRSAGIRPVLLTSSPEERAEQYQPAGSRFNPMLEKYAAIVQALAEQQDLPFADQFHPYIDLVDRARRKDPGFKTMPDRVHPFPSGHLVMAWGVLSGLRADPLVSEVTIDPRGSGNARTRRAEVKDLAVRDGVITFTREDQCLPLPLPAEAPVVLPHAPILQELSQHMLRVVAPTARSYELRIDGQKVGTAASADLTAGWNLTAAATPEAARAKALMEKVVAKNNLFFNRWRQVLVPALVAKRENDAAVKSQLAQFDRRIAEAEAEIETARKPAPHRYELRPIG